MDAILWIDDKARVWRVGDLIDTGGTIALSGLVIEGEVLFNWNIEIGEMEMNGLIFFVMGIAEVDGGEAIEADGTVGFGIGDGSAVRGEVEASVIVFAVFEGVGKFWHEGTEP